MEIIADTEDTEDMFDTKDSEDPNGSKDTKGNGSFISSSSKDPFNMGRSASVSTQETIMETSIIRKGKVWETAIIKEINDDKMENKKRCQKEVVVAQSEVFDDDADWDKFGLKVSKDTSMILQSPVRRQSGRVKMHGSMIHDRCLNLNPITSQSLN
jgi:hypothetical protein